MQILPRGFWGWLRVSVLFFAVLMVVPTSPAWWGAQARVVAAVLFTNRVRDGANILSIADELHFERFLQLIDDESGVDIRFLLVPEVRGETLEAFGVRMARSLGVGRDADRRGLLFVYDAAERRLRIEVGAQMEGIITDAFAGYLMREHVSSFFGAGSPSLGLRTTLFMVQHRLREAVLGQAFDPGVLRFIADTRRLAVGGGASEPMGAHPTGGFVNSERPSDAATRRHFAPQPTPELAYQRYLEWLAVSVYQTDVPLFTPVSQEYIAKFPMTRGYKAYILAMMYGRPYRIDTRGDLALLHFTTTPLVSPLFLRRGPDGWALDIMAEVLDTRNYVGFWYTWGMLETRDDFATAFADRYVDMGGILRLTGGDNRPLPSRANPDIVLERAPDPADSVAHVTVDEVAAQIGAAEGRALIVLYQIWDKQSMAALPALNAVVRECRDAGVTPLVFATDQRPRAIEQLPRVLRRAGAPFTAVHLRQWPPGRLTSSMAPLGITVHKWWAAPIMAVRVSGAGVVAQTEGLEALVNGATEIRTACARQ